MGNLSPPEWFVIPAPLASLFWCDIGFAFLALCSSNEGCLLWCFLFKMRRLASDVLLPCLASFSVCGYRVLAASEPRGTPSPTPFGSASARLTLAIPGEEKSRPPDSGQNRSHKTDSCVPQYPPSTDTWFSITICSPAKRSRSGGEK